MTITTLELLRHGFNFSDDSDYTKVNFEQVSNSSCLFMRSISFLTSRITDDTGPDYFLTKF